MNQTAALQKVQPNALDLAKEYNLTEGYIQTVKNTIAKGATDNELRLFLETARRTGLDPMARQIFCVKRYAGGKEVMSVQTSIDGFRLIADRTKQYVPSREPTYTFDKDGNIESATAYVKKLVAGTWHEIPATAFYDEYVQTTKDGKPNSMWRKMPRLMLAKCAESLALRKAFPAQLSGLYTSEEMNTSTDDIPNAIVQGTSQAQLALVEQPKPQAKTEDQPKTHLQIIKEVTDELNAANDSIVWDRNTLAEYCNEFFDEDGYAPVRSFRELNDEQKEVIIGDLFGRLEERKAIVGDSEAIDGEIVEPNINDVDDLP